LPFGNWTDLMERSKVGGTRAALTRRSILESGFAYSADLTSYRVRGTAPGQVLRGAQGAPARAGNQLDLAKRVSIVPRRQSL
jgi:outer membrane receptor protein involved in Fe transport